MQPVRRAHIPIVLSRWICRLWTPSMFSRYDSHQTKDLTHGRTNA